MLQTLLAATKKESIQFQHRSVAVYLYNEAVAQFSNYALLTQARYIHLAVLFFLRLKTIGKNPRLEQRLANNTFSLDRLANSEFY